MAVIADIHPYEQDSFAHLVATLDDLCDLARPALALAADEYPGLNVDRFLHMLDDLADEALQSAVVGSRSDCEAARRLSLFLADKKGFHGNNRDYYDPRNSFLSDVIERRCGIPITLSLVVIEVGRRLGVPLVGIGFPGHFLVGCGPYRRNEYLLLDPFCDGKIVDWNECELRLRTVGKAFDPEVHLTPVSNRQFLVRMLNNLKAVYMVRRDIDRAMRTVARLTLIDPAFTEDYRQFAQILAEEGASEDARRCLRAYLDTAPTQADAVAARELMSRLLDLRARRN